MKKIIFNMIFVGLISIMALPLCVSAKSISTLETSESDGKITVSGATEDGVLAIVAFVYSGDNLVYMETCESSANSYSCLLHNTFSKGDYIVKVADYDGGDYVVDNVSISNDVSKKNPKTRDGIINFIIIGSISLIGLLGVGLYSMKKKIN